MRSGYRKGYRYLTVVADHDQQGAVVWAGEDRSSATLSRFFSEFLSQPLGRGGPMLPGNLLPNLIAILGSVFFVVGDVDR